MRLSVWLRLEMVDMNREWSCRVVYRIGLVEYKSSWMKWWNRVIKVIVKWRLEYNLLSDNNTNTDNQWSV